MARPAPHTWTGAVTDESRSSAGAGAPAQLGAERSAPQVAEGVDRGAAGVDQAAVGPAAAAAAAACAARLGRACDRRLRVQRAGVCLRGPRIVVRLLTCRYPMSCLLVPAPCALHMRRFLNTLSLAATSCNGGTHIRQYEIYLHFYTEEEHPESGHAQAMQR